MVELNKEQLTRRKVELLQVTSSPGWFVAVELAEEVAQDAERKALECDKEDEVVRLQRKAQAARQFLKTWLGRIEQYKNLDVTKEDDFIPLNY